MPQHWTQAGNPANPPLVMLHGFMGRAYDMNDIRRALAIDHCCLVCDLPGHGDCNDGYEVGDYTVEATTAALIALMDRLGIARADLLGYSLGGRVALYAALAHPERFDRLVLESASAGLADPEARRRRREEDRRRAGILRAEGVAAFVETWYDQPLFASLRERPLLLERLKSERGSNDAEGLARSLESIGAGTYPSLWDRLPELAMPVLLVCGERDEKYMALNREMADLLPDARLSAVAEAGHNVHLERPAMFTRLVGEFLAGPSGALES